MSVFPQYVLFSVVRHCSITLFTFQTSFLSIIFESLIIYSFYSYRLLMLHKSKDFILSIIQENMHIYIFSVQWKKYTLKKNGTLSFCYHSNCPQRLGIQVHLCALLHRALQLFLNVLLMKREKPGLWPSKKEWVRGYPYLSCLSIGQIIFMNFYDTII